jgi:hypothetical protein
MEGDLGTGVFRFKSRSHKKIVVKVHHAVEKLCITCAVSVGCLSTTCWDSPYGCMPKKSGLKKGRLAQETISQAIDVKNIKR